MVEYFGLIGLILVIYIGAYGIINRICTCIEHRTYAKCGIFPNSGQSKNTEDLQNPSEPIKRR